MIRTIYNVLQWNAASSYLYSFQRVQNPQSGKLSQPKHSTLICNDKSKIKVVKYLMQDGVLSDEGRGVIFLDQDVQLMTVVEIWN